MKRLKSLLFNMNKLWLNTTVKIASIKHCMQFAQYLSTVQAMRDFLTDDVALWWFVLLFANDHDEPLASNAYARHGGRKSTADERQRIEDDERERTRSGGLASEVSSKKRDDAGGQVVTVTGKNFGRDFNYVTNILYDEYGQRTRIDYGNGTHTEYKYDAARRWLDSILTRNKHDEVYQNIVYDFDKVGNVRSYTNDCLDEVRGNYKTRQEYEYDALYQLTKASGETTYNPYRSMNPEHVSSYTQDFKFDVAGLGNMVSKVSVEDVRPNGKTLGDGLNYSFEYVYDENFAHRLVRAGNRWYKYDSNGNVVFEKDLPEGMTLEDDANTVALSRVQTIRENVYAIDEGWGLFANDSPSARGRTNKRSGGRTYTWNERNQLISTVDDNRSTSYVYDYNGTRTNKYSRGTETLYFNQFYSVRYDGGVGYGSGQSVKHIYLGDTRIVTKLNSVKNASYSEEYHKQYFYHSDHLGSASLISDFEGREYQRIEYTPYGETWVERTSNTGMEYLPYKFTGKERDEETGLYYFGARYLDPVRCRWMTTDPALSYFMQGKSNGASGGIYNFINLNLYHYGGNNPIRYTDPTGMENDTDIPDLKLLRKLGEEMFHKGTINGIDLFLGNSEDGCFARATVIAGELEKLGFEVDDYSYAKAPVKPDAVKSEKNAGRDPSKIPVNDRRRFSFHVAATVKIGDKKYTVDPFYHKSWLSISEQGDWNSCQYPIGTGTQPAHDKSGNLIGPSAMNYWQAQSKYTGNLPINQYAQGWLKNYDTIKKSGSGVSPFIWRGK